MGKKQALNIPTCNACANGNNLICHLSHGQQAALSEFKLEAVFRKGSVIFREGDRPNGLFCIHKGKVKVTKLTNSGREQVVRLSKEGEILGYRALFAGEEYTATATALEDCEICQLSKERFYELMTANPEFNRAILQMLAQDVRRAEDTWTDQNQKGAKARVAEAILYLYRKFGTEADGRTLSVSLSRQDIADLAGVASETAIRSLSFLDAEGILGLEGKVIRILNMHSLEQLSVEHNA